MREGSAPLARFEGEFDVEAGCLVFRMGDETFLPAFVTAGNATLSGNSELIGERQILLRERAVYAGASLTAKTVASVRSAPPATCS